MAKQLSELIKKTDPVVVAAARVQADQGIFELRLAQLRQTVDMIWLLHLEYRNPPSPIWKNAATKSRYLLSNVTLRHLAANCLWM